MPEWIFQGGKEEFRIRQGLDKKLNVKSKITNFEWLPFEEKLFGNREERNKCHIMNLKVPKLTKDELHIYIIHEILFGKFTQCYKYVGSIDDEGNFIANEVINKEKQIQNGYSAIRE